MTDPYRTPESLSPRRIVQIAASESDSNGEVWSIAVHALDDRGDVWRAIATSEKGPNNTTILKKPKNWVKLPPLPSDPERTDG